jgi:hypothetical protein
VRDGSKKGADLTGENRIEISCHVWQRMSFHALSDHDKHKAIAAAAQIATAFSFQ